MIDHEALGHGRFTDLEARKRAEDSGRIKFNNLSGGIQNILEDVYIENRAIAAYPGVKHNLKTMVEILVGRGFFGEPSAFESAPASALLMAGLLNTLRARLVPGQESVLKVNVDALEPILQRKLGNLWSDVLAVAMEVQNSKVTDDNIALTIRIMALIEQAASDQPEPDQETQASEADDDQATNESNGNVGKDEMSDESNDQKAGAVEGKSSDEGDPAHTGEAAKGNSKAGDEAGTSPSNRSVKENQAAQEIMAQQDHQMPITEVIEGASISIGDKATPAPMSDLAKIDGRCDMPLDVKRIASMVKSAADDLQDALLAETRRGSTWPPCQCDIWQRVSLGQFALSDVHGHA